MNVARINAYIIAQKKNHQVKTQNQFVIMSWINALNQRAVYEEYQTTRASAAAALMTPPAGSAKKMKRVGHKRPTLPDFRFLGKKEEHVPVLAAKQMSCRYCSYLCAVAKLDGEQKLPTVARPQKKCLMCDNNHLCVLFHFDLYHTRE
jgi:hypothetical protein